MTATIDELVRIARAHAAAEAADDFETTMAALEADPVYELRNEWVNDQGLAQEYVIEFRHDGGPRERHPVMAVLTFGAVALSGERVYASDRLLQLLFGPTLALATSLP
jgi:hypothetical protein